MCFELGVSRRRMGSGGGWCRICELYIMHDKGRRCPCCRCQVRTRVYGSAIASGRRAFSRPRAG